MWVDIISAEAHRVRLDDENLEHHHQVILLEDPKESIGAICLTKNDDVILMCCKYGVRTGNFVTGETKSLVDYNHSSEQKARLRSNDGIIDPQGNLWIGVMSDFTAGGVVPEGFLYRIDHKDLSIKVMVEGARIPNGLAFSGDAKRFYWTDSLTFTLWQFDYDPETATLSNRKACVEYKTLLPELKEPAPDGLAMTDDGYIYQAVFSGSQVLKVTPDAKIHERYTLPASSVTSAGVGGKNDDILFITTATLDHEENPNRPDATDKTGDLGGYLYQIRLDNKLKREAKYVWGGEVDV